MHEFLGIFKNTRKHLMNGVSYMLPFVVSGGVLLALAVTFYGQGGVPPEGTFLYDLFQLGAVGLGYMVPIFSAYIAFSIADRAGIAPGMIGGAIANTIGAGFLGGIVSGLFAGVLCFYLKKIKLPSSLKSVMPIIVIPILGTFITWVFMYYVVGAPIAGLMASMTAFLEHMSNGNKILLGLICGLMIGFDLGGPVNKVAFAFGVATVSAGIYTYAAPMAVAICTPPLGMALASFIAKDKFTEEEREAGKGAILMGAVGITEGAIPFAGNDPIRVIAATMSGSAVGAAVAYLFDTTSKVAWGGLIILPVVGNIPGYLIAVAIGPAVTAAVVIALKKPIAKKAEQTKESSAPSEDIDLDFE